MTPKGRHLREDSAASPSAGQQNDLEITPTPPAMAINTDAAFGKSALGEREASNLTDFQDTEKLLSAPAAEPTGETNLKPSDSFSLNVTGSVRSLDAEQDGHRSPMKSGSVGQLSGPPRSASRISLGQLSSPVPPGSAPSLYLWLAVLSCFCPTVSTYAPCGTRTWSVLHTGDTEGAKKYGRLSMLFSVLAILLGVPVIIFIAYTLDQRT